MSLWDTSDPKYSNGQQVHEKMLSITKHEAANQNHNDQSLHTHYNACYQKRQEINVNESNRKGNPCTVLVKIKIGIVVTGLHYKIYYLVLILYGK